MTKQSKKSTDDSLFGIPSKAERKRAKKDEKAIRKHLRAQNRGALVCPDISGSLHSVLAERIRQDGQWGEQNHDMFIWSAILTEECGEFAQAALQAKFGGPAGAHLRKEAVQCAAVALAIVECIDRATATR